MITGHTRLYGILGHPIGHVRTPQVLNAAFVERGHDGVMMPMDVAPKDLAETVAGLAHMKNFRGAVVTVPHKTAIMRLCSVVSPRARLAGAANIFRPTGDGRLHADLFDGEGFVAGLSMAGYDVKGMRVWLLGAGGAARAIALALAEHGADGITISNRSPFKSRDLVDALRPLFPKTDFTDRGDPAGHDLIVNATSLGLERGDALPVDSARLRPGMVVADVIMNSELTPFLAAAREIGCAVHPGRKMLEGQLDRILEFLVNPTAP